MRVTGGTLAGRTVKVPPGVIRPAMDRMRESVFSILGPLDGLSFLDLFSGSGIMSLEAVSRGAVAATLVERDPRKRATLLSNLEMCPVASQLVMAPVERYVSRCRDTFDLVFMDPPFDYRFKSDLLRRIGRKAIVRAGGRLLIHLPAQEGLPERAGHLVLADERRYGGSKVCFYDAESAGGPSDDE